MKLLAKSILGLALFVPIAASYAVGAVDSGGDACRDVVNAARAEGYTAGDAAGYARGYKVGFGDGSAAGIAKCVADPQSCNISLASCIPDATYGETEPNDNIITADPLKQGVAFWGQNSSVTDQDWFYTETTKANQNILLTFSVPDWIKDVDLSAGVPSIWNVSVRDAAGNIFADFDTNILGGLQSTSNAMTYNVTAGLAGSYYVVVKPKDKTQPIGYSYSVSTIVQDSTLDTAQPVVGFYDTEVEPNNLPSRSNALATGVSMYGLINLTFNGVVTDPEDDTKSVWGQGENDWYVYYTDGNELVTFTFCAREACGAGNWYIDVYDQASAKQWQALVESGTSTQALEPLLAFNTDTTIDPTTFRIGLRDPGYYFVRVNHKRLFTAPCNEQRLVTSAGFVSGAEGLCSCASDGAIDANSTGNSCYIPTDACGATGSTLLCTKAADDCTVGSDPGCVYNTSSPPGCSTKGGTDATGKPLVLCSTYITSARCACSSYGNVVEVPEGAYTSPYNFTWYGTKLPTNTADTDAYDDFWNRASPY